MGLLMPWRSAAWRSAAWRSAAWPIRADDNVEGTFPANISCEHVFYLFTVYLAGADAVKLQRMAPPRKSILIKKAMEFQQCCF